MKRALIGILICLLLVPFALAQECTENCGEAPNTTAAAGLTAAQINAIPKIPLFSLEPNRDLMHDRRYVRVKGAVDVYDAPDGNFVRSILPGLVFLTAGRDENGWTRINPGEWVKTEFLTNTNWVVSSFTGVLLPEDALPYSIAWALKDVYVSTEPGVEPPAESDTLPLITRYSLLNIYATADVAGYRWYQIGADQWIHQHNVAKVIPITEKPEGIDTDLWFSIDLFEQVVIAYQGDRPIFSTLVSTGLPRWPTYEGLFHIFYRNEREHMTWGTVGDDYYFLEEVPYTMFFDDGRALHGEYWHDGLGYRRSHGCVNMSITDAHWMFETVREFMGPDAAADDLGPAVYVYSSDIYK
jgi:hypothetical protein